MQPPPGRYSNASVPWMWRCKAPGYRHAECGMAISILNQSAGMSRELYGRERRNTNKPRQDPASYECLRDAAKGYSDRIAAPWGGRGNPFSRVHSKKRAVAGISAERTEFQIIPLIAGSQGKGPASGWQIWHPVLKCCGDSQSATWVLVVLISLVDGTPVA